MGTTSGRCQRRCSRWSLMGVRASSARAAPAFTIRVAAARSALSIGAFSDRTIGVGATRSAPSARAVAVASAVGVGAAGTALSIGTATLAAIGITATGAASSVRAVAMTTTVRIAAAPAALSARAFSVTGAIRIAAAAPSRCGGSADCEKPKQRTDHRHSPHKDFHDFSSTLLRSSSSRLLFFLRAKRS